MFLSFGHDDPYVGELIPGFRKGKFRNLENLFLIQLAHQIVQTHFWSWSFLGWLWAEFCWRGRPKQWFCNSDTVSDYPFWVVEWMCNWSNRPAILHFPISTHIQWILSKVTSAPSFNNSASAQCNEKKRCEPKILDPRKGARDGQNLISWRWSLPLPTNKRQKLKVYNHV